MNKLLRVYSVKFKFPNFKRCAYKQVCGRLRVFACASIARGCARVLLRTSVRDACQGVRVCACVDAFVNVYMCARMRGCARTCVYKHARAYM